MKTMMVVLALALVAIPTARPAFAKRYDDFELKELRQQREDRKKEKQAVQEDEAEEQMEATRKAHARATHAQDREDDVGGTTEPDVGGDD